jgi:hypothetical protein
LLDLFSKHWQSFFVESNDKNKNHFAKYGLDADIQKRFYSLFGKKEKLQQELEDDLKDLAQMKTQKDVHRQLFAIVARVLRRNETLYHPPACPREATLIDVIALLNGEQAVIQDTLKWYGLE